jgi:hypothetical protein
MKHLINGTFLALLFVLSACSKISSTEVDASAIYGELGLSRTEGSSQATVSATFFVGGPTGTVVQMESPVTVTINGREASEMTDPILNMTSYVSSVSTNAIVVYTDKNGASYTNTLFMPGSMTMSLPAATAYISQGFTINYSSSSPFVSNETLEVSMSGNLSSSRMVMGANAGASSGSVTVSNQDLSGFSSGPISVQICRHTNPDAQAPYPKGTMVTISSCSRAQTVNLQH